MASLISCQEKDNEKSYFNADKLDEFNLENLSEFYGVEVLSTYSSPFKNFYGYVDGIGYENSEKGICVSIFESQEKAVECMQDRIRTVSCVIENGKSNVLDYPWWYSDCFSKAIYLNQENTIIEIYSSHDSLDFLITTVKEITTRVKYLSE